MPYKLINSIFKLSRALLARRKVMLSEMGFLSLLLGKHIERESYATLGPYVQCTKRSIFVWQKFSERKMMEGPVE
jgi:hypothetical protein